MITTKQIGDYKKYRGQLNKHQTQINTKLKCVIENIIQETFTDIIEISNSFNIFFINTGNNMAKIIQKDFQRFKVTRVENIIYFYLGLRSRYINNKI